MTVRGTPEVNRQGSLPRQERRDGAMREDERVAMIGEDRPTGVVDVDACHSHPIDGAEKHVTQVRKIRHARLHGPGPAGNGGRAGGIRNRRESIRLKLIPARGGRLARGRGAGRHAAARTCGGQERHADERRGKSRAPADAQYARPKTAM